MENISLYSTHPISLLAPMFYLKSICYKTILEKISLYSTHPICWNKSFSHFQIPDLAHTIIFSIFYIHRYIYIYICVCVCVYILYIYIFFFSLFFLLSFLIQFFSFTIYCCCTQHSFINVLKFGLDHDILQSKVPISVFDAGVAVLGLNSNCIELVLRSVGDQQASEARVIRFRCSSDRIEKFGGSFFWEMKCHPVLSRSQESVLTTKLWSRFCTRTGSWSAQHTIAGRSLR